MATTIPRICEVCGDSFVRRGRATQCVKCNPPKSAGEPTRPKGVNRDNDMAYAVEFIGGCLLTAGIGLQSVDRHDAAVILRSASTLPKQLGRVMEQDAAMADAIVKFARKGSLYYLGVTVLVTVVAPILAHHHIGPGALAMSEDAVNQTLGSVTETLMRMTAESANAPADDSNGIDVSDLDLSFLNAADAVA
jgi:hypothetical protein